MQTKCDLFKEWSLFRGVFDTWKKASVSEPLIVIGRLLQGMLFGGNTVSRLKEFLYFVLQLLRKFRMVAFIATTLIRLKSAIMVNSLDKTERSAAEIQWRTLYGQQESEKLAFNKTYYSREKVSLAQNVIIVK